ncbi:unnamed protein product, partial [Phytomonas sp. Hart1]
MELCGKRWYRSLSELLIGALETNAAASSTLQADLGRDLLCKLYFTAMRLRPGLCTLRQDGEAILKDCEIIFKGCKLPAGTARVLFTELWGPLLAAAEAAAGELRRHLKDHILAPVLAQTADYCHFHAWFHPAGRHLVEAAPSEAVRELGEAILAIPLKLEALRGAAVDWRAIHDLGSSFIAANDTLEALFVEETESWLDDLVHAAVGDFVENKILQVEFDFSEDRTDPLLKQKVSIVLRQLLADLDYMKNVLSAVSDDHFDNLEKVLMKLNTLLSVWETSMMLRKMPFRVCELISDASE